MDRRSVLGFVLIFLIIMGYPYIMKKLYPPAPGGGAADPTAVESVRSDTETATTPLVVAEVEPEPEADRGTSQQPVTANEALSPVGDIAAATVQVSTPLYRLSLDTRGGRIVSWEGLEHKSWQGGVVQLVPANIPDRGGDAVIFRGADLDLGGIVYQADRMALDLSSGQGEGTVSLTARTRGGLEIRKVFTFASDVYGIQVEMRLASDEAGAGRTLGLTGTPEVFRFGWNQGIAPTERIQRLEETSLRSLARVGADTHYKKRDGLKKDVAKVEGRWLGSVRFAGLQNRYFTIVGIVPQEQGEPIEGAIGLSGDTETMNQSWSVDVPARNDSRGGIAAARLDLYIGPQQADLLSAYGQGLEETMDLGWKWVRPLSRVVLWGMEQMHRVIPNYGVIIIIFSILTKVMFYPLTKTSTQSMKKMQDLQPKLKELQKKYKDDKEKLNQATMKLYKEEKVNPLAGCLPLLVQSPVFIALYQGLSHTISLRGQPFVAWITDLSQPDAIMTMPFSLPFLGSDLNVLPILMAVAMYFQTKFTPSSGGGQMAMMNTMMPLFMIFIFYNMPSGLVLYWLVNTLLQGYQSWKIHKTAPQSGGTATT